MKKIVLYCLLWAAGTSLVSAQHDDPFRGKCKQMMTILQSTHYKPPVINDTFSADLFNRTINYLDPNHLYFTAEDIKQLRPFSTKLDEEINGDEWEFLPAITSIMKERVEESRALVTRLLSQPFPASSKESMPLEPAADKFYPKAEMESHWKRWLKYRMLDTFYESVNDSIPVADIKKKYMESEPAVRAKLLKSEERKLQRLMEYPDGVEGYTGFAYLLNISTGFDPHSMFLPSQIWQHFRASMESEGFSFGMELNEDENGNVFIEGLVPGGPAWKSGKLHQGDAILRFKWKDGKEEFELEGAGFNEVAKVLSQGASMEGTFAFRKSNGQTLNLTLPLQKSESDDQIVKSFILEGEKKIGLIILPGFYMNTDDGGTGCANDVAREILRLKNEGIEGLIMDLRFNGGGSLMEGLDLAGIFINEGPFMMLNDRTGKAMVLKDPNRGIAYSGPLTVMVNGQSASASEIFAAILQDYHRAVIVGEPTYGKATSQIVIPLAGMSGMDGIMAGANQDVVKVTNGMIFRNFGKSYQRDGVTPDITLSDVYTLRAEKEADQPHAFMNMEIEKRPAFTPLAKPDVDKLHASSINRRGEEDLLEKVSALGDSLKEIIGLAVPLDLEKYIIQRKQFSTITDSIEAMQEERTPQFTVRNTVSETKFLEENAYYKKLNEERLESLLKDIYLEETFFITSDLITNNSKP